MIEGISTNSTAFLEEIAEGEKPKGVGNPTEVALLLWLNSRNRDYLELRENAPVVDQLTFSTERKFMATLVKSPLMGKKVLYVKGAPEIVLGKCKDVILTATGRCGRVSLYGRKTIAGLSEYGDAYSWFCFQDRGRYGYKGLCGIGCRS